MPAHPSASRRYLNDVAAREGQSADELREARRRLRLRLQEILWIVSSVMTPGRKFPLRDCGRIPRLRNRDVSVMSGRGGARFAGFYRCGMIWQCPTCGPAIRQRRAEEISKGAGAWIRQGNSALGAALTFPHNSGMRLAPLMVMVADTFRFILADRGWRRLKADLGIKGQIRAFEVTHGARGWHPHLHVLIFLEGDLPPDALGRVQLYLCGCVEADGDGAGVRAPRAVHGVKVQQITSR